MWRMGGLEVSRPRTRRWQPVAEGKRSMLRCLAIQFVSGPVLCLGSAPQLLGEHEQRSLYRLLQDHA